MAWPRSTRGAQTQRGWGEPGWGLGGESNAFPKSCPDVELGRWWRAELRYPGTLWMWDPRHPRGGHVHYTMVGGAERSQPRKCPKFSSERLTGLNFEM